MSGKESMRGSKESKASGKEGKKGGNNSKRSAKEANEDGKEARWIVKRKEVVKCQLVIINSENTMVNGQQRAVKSYWVRQKFTGRGKKLSRVVRGKLSSLFASYGRDLKSVGKESNIA